MKTKLLGAVCVVFAIAVSLLAFSDIARSDVLFSDDFNSGASAAWGNDLGIGQQMAASTARKIRATNQILTRSSRRVISGRDGGIWLRASPNAGTIGVTGILLIFLNDELNNNMLFWHEVGNGYGP